MSTKTYDVIKRAMDVVVSASLLIVTSPIQLGTAIAVRTFLGSPVLFRQSRPGRNGKVFVLIKFRSMRPIDAEHGLITDQSRMSRVGAVLRATSLDELPTLWNVLIGDMSLVGPRPLLVEYLPVYSAKELCRHDVKPGLTGLAQVRGRNAIDWDERLALDTEYVDRRSLRLDLRILASTVSTVARRSGVSAVGHVTMPRLTDVRAGASDAQVTGDDLNT